MISQDSKEGLIQRDQHFISAFLQSVHLKSECGSLCKGQVLWTGRTRLSSSRIRSSVITEKDLPDELAGLFSYALIRRWLA